jgi:hypothetical protein
MGSFVLRGGERGERRLSKDLGLENEYGIICPTMCLFILYRSSKTKRNEAVLDGNCFVKKTKANNSGD